MKTTKMGIKYVVVVLICLTVASCGKTKTTIVNSPEIDEEQILKNLFMKETNPWKEIEKGYYTNSDGSEIIVTEENRWASLLQQYGEKYLYPIRDYETKEEIIRIPQEELTEASQWYWYVLGFNTSLNDFRRRYNLTDISFIGILRIYEHNCDNYVIKDGIGYLQARADEPNIWRNFPGGIPFDRGDLIKNEVVVEK